ncbi:MAG: response regulator [Oscillospiraceae bacterium]|nr:response regulator [Oscillospiraceae bacterium]
MINVLIAENNISYTKTLITAVNRINTSAKVYNISTDGEETLNLLNTEDNIDLVLLDLKLPKYSGIEVLNLLSESKKKKYHESVIVISSKLDTVFKIKDNDMLYSYVIKPIELFEITNKINNFVHDKHNHTDYKIIKNKITHEVQHLGYDLSYNGTKYLIESIYFVMRKYGNEHYISNLEKEIYPTIATKYNTTIHNIKWNINKSTTSMYYQCEKEILKQYFKLQDDVKPKTQTIIYTIINKIEK